ncbi:hypothetical protein A0H81_06664 [Grifola frondosa]|uniref:AB hydrolase-1 domain-containing protein n=1 Tax=Grifola frondosa TaxID=5627 RepID=A0A1C7MAQ2_GRIFR|nr:hypothetical protein A0H81_06664 [Grifola frondosa]
MPLAKLTNEVSFYFEDYGAPPSNTQNYTTLVMLHGGAVHSATFRRLIPFAHQNNIRLVLVNRRGYPGTTPFTASELQCIYTADLPAQSDLLRSQGAYVAEFLLWFIRKEGIPPKLDTDGEKSGGISVLGWSIGNAPVISFLAHAHELSDADQAVLGAYLRTAIMYDPPSVTLGLPPPPPSPSGAFYAPGAEMELSMAERLLLCIQWVSTYNKHANLASRDPNGLVTGPHPPYAALDPLPLLVAMSQEEVAAQTDLEAFAAEALFYLIPADVYHSEFIQAYFPSLAEKAGGAGTTPALPDVRVRHVWCDMSVWQTVWAAWGVEKMLQEHKNGGRDVELVPLKGVNHFAHWDEPEKVMTLFASLA